MAAITIKISTFSELMPKCKAPILCKVLDDLTLLIDDGEFMMKKKGA